MRSCAANGEGGGQESTGDQSSFVVEEGSRPDHNDAPRARSLVVRGRVSIIAAPLAPAPWQDDMSHAVLVDELPPASAVVVARAREHPLWLLLFLACAPIVSGVPALGRNRPSFAARCRRFAIPRALVAAPCGRLLRVYSAGDFSGLFLSGCGCFAAPRDRFIACGFLAAPRRRLFPLHAIRARRGPLVARWSGFAIP